MEDFIETVGEGRTMYTVWFDTKDAGPVQMNIREESAGAALRLAKDALPPYIATCPWWVMIGEKVVLDGRVGQKDGHMSDNGWQWNRRKPLSARRISDRAALNWYALFWVVILALAITSVFVYAHQKRECNAEHGVLVRGAYYYECIERGQH